jgi:hypothetical protein
VTLIKSAFAFRFLNDDEEAPFVHAFKHTSSVHGSQAAVRSVAVSGETTRLSTFVLSIFTPSFPTTASLFKPISGLVGADEGSFAKLAVVAVVIKILRK